MKTLKALFILFLLAPMAAQAGDLVVSNAYSYATSPVQKNGAIFLTITGANDRLLSAATPVATSAELHTMKSTDGVMMMRKVDGFDTPLQLEAMGDHIMLMGLKAPLKMGDHFPLTLTFKKQGTVTTDVLITAPGTKP